LASKALPKRIVDALRIAKDRLPLRLSQSAPVIQAYLDDGETRSFVGIHNFYSVLLPSVRTEAVAELVFRDAEGRIVLRHRRELPHLGATTIDVSALFAAHQVRSRFGIVTVQLSPRHARRRDYRALGRVTSHFFVCFQTVHGAIGQIHPLSTADEDNRAAGPFRSSQLISTAGLLALEVLQYNATRERHRMRHQLVNALDGRVIATQELDLAPMGTALTRFAAAEFEGVPVLGFGIDRLPSHNAKPVLRRVYGPGLYSVSHA
jgi:hypothetical protein